MLQMVLRRIGMMILIMLVVALLLFLINEGDPRLIARSVLGPYAQAEQLDAWIAKNGYDRSLFIRYFEWIGRVLTGDLGQSIIYKRPVSEIFWSRLGNTGILAGVTFVIMVIVALVLGVLAGMREGSLLDRTISVFSIATTSVPEYASAVILAGLFVFHLQWLPGTSSMTSGFDPVQLILPVLVLTLYGFGYIARMTRASMAEVMTTHYIRTAILKGLPYKRIIMKHALRNALIAPFTVIIPPNDQYRLAQMLIPMDDGNTMFYWIAFHETKGIAQDEWRKFCGAEIGKDIDDNYRKIRTLDNMFLQDRDAMKDGDFTGIYGIPAQDMAMWESMGAIADRTHDYLGVSDGAVAQFRRVMIAAARDFQDGKPAIATRAAGRSVALGDLASYEGMIPKDSNWKQGLTYRQGRQKAA